MSCLFFNTIFPAARPVARQPVVLKGQNRCLGLVPVLRVIDKKQKLQVIDKEQKFSKEAGSCFKKNIKKRKENINQNKKDNDEEIERDIALEKENGKKNDEEKKELSKQLLKAIKFFNVKEYHKVIESSTWDISEIFMNSAFNKCYGYPMLLQKIVVYWCGLSELMPKTEIDLAAGIEIIKDLLLKRSNYNENFNVSGLSKINGGKLCNTNLYRLIEAYGLTENVLELLVKASIEGNIDLVEFLLRFPSHWTEEQKEQIRKDCMKIYIDEFIAPSSTEKVELDAYNEILFSRSLQEISIS